MNRPINLTKIFARLVFGLFLISTLNLIQKLNASPIQLAQSNQQNLKNRIVKASSQPTDKIAQNKQVAIIETKNLSTVIKPKQVQKKVILLYVSSPFCRYCRMLEKEILYPLIKSGDYKNKVLLRKLVIDSPQPITNFKTQLQKPKSLMEEYGVKITPTLLFLDKNGRQLSDAIVGYANDEFFWYYLDQAIEKSNQQLKGLSAGSDI